MPVVVSMKCVKGLLVALCSVYVLVSDHVYILWSPAYTFFTKTLCLVSGQLCF